ncbi:alpha/beta fold hydrolase [Streptomyces litchfieldiae]|uniref:Alpha/beta hydrolase n=1 Tax=Streptomyces litchfieldiae TaxID=3075543 RepID=A0ABU2MWG2_9ACTN|nr:alpha/beta hydrolase [Streptomyces sp. DSM 44938]MDT0345993.1 alpha/beta hydrolase [Streptomyces sp. DSM 44938]
MRRRHLLGAGTALALATAVAPAAARPSPDGLRRTDLWTGGEGGPRIHVREILAPGAGRAARPLLLVHGARPDGTSAFDLPVPGGSLAADLALADHAVYVMDIRGFGSSDYPEEMSQEPVAGAPLVRSNEAVADINVTAAFIRRRRRTERLAALGWATGGHWLGMFAALHPDALDALIILNALYSGTSSWPLQAELEDPERPGHPRPQPGWRAVTADSLTARWDNENPGDRRDPAVVDAYRRAALAADPTSAARTPPSFRNPTGPLTDAFYLAQGRQFYDASLIRARTLVLRGEADFWSRPEDSTRLLDHLTSAPEARAVTLRGASHYTHLERAPHGRDELLAEVTDFLGGGGR